MGWFSNLKERIAGMFNGRKQITEGNINSQNKAYKKNDNMGNGSNNHIFTRNDESTIEIEPVLDDTTGHQAYKSISNIRTGQTELLPRFIIRSDELERIHTQLFSVEVLMNVKSNDGNFINAEDWLNNPELSDAIVNRMLSADRIVGKIFNPNGEYGYKETRTDYVGYAGTCEVEQTEKGVVCKAIRDKGISDSLVMSAEQRARKINAEMKRRDDEKNKRILNSVGDNTYHDPRNDAGVLRS